VDTNSSARRVAGALTAAAAIAAPAAVAAEAQTDAAAPKLRVAAKHHVLYGSKAPIKGSLSSGARGKRVVVQIASGHRWKTIARTRTRAGGRFSASWRAKRLGRFRMRAVAPGTRAPAGRVRGKVVVYRAAQASWYGPGLYGNKMACGGRLSPGTIGVANKTLPCGTRVTIRYHGRTVTAPVVDRGPYAGDREYDLTEATKNRLRFSAVGTVWASK
jgi:rare lipoprotein A (peptidoglycan hydrolase)